jgi:hypothetical protein
MKLYHGTTEESWKEIQAEGVLWGRKNRLWEGRLLDRVTWLAVKNEHAGIFDERGITNQPCVILEVEWPDEYIHPDCWQITTYEPIPISRVRRVND